MAQHYLVLPVPGVRKGVVGYIVGRHASHGDAKRTRARLQASVMKQRGATLALRIEYGQVPPGEQYFLIRHRINHLSRPAL